MFGFSPVMMGKSSPPYLPIPAMTSNTTPAGWEAFANSAEISRPAWNAFDGNTSSSYWQPSDAVFPQLFGLSAPAQFRVVKYALYSANITVRAPKDFKLQGSNDGASWDDLDIKSGITWASTYQRQEWSVTSPGNYNRYRVLISATGSTLSSVAELELLQEDDL